jgi:hypothetical protein
MIINFTSGGRDSEGTRLGCEEGPMVKLTKKMNEVLKNADLARGEINNVPMSTLYGLEDRKLVTSEWRKGANRIILTTAGGTFPVYSKVKLTESGLHEARSAQGLRAIPLDLRVE